MDENQNDGADILNELEDADLNTANEEVNEEQGLGESVEDYKERLAKAEELAKNYRIRAEKAERLSKSVKTEKQPEAKAPTAGEITTRDLYALMQANIPEEDIDVVQKFASLEGISLKDAASSPIVKGILSQRNEERTVSLAASKGSSKRGSGKMTDDILMSEASKGKLPESHDDMVRLIKARKGL